MLITAVIVVSCVSIGMLLLPPACQSAAIGTCAIKDSGEAGQSTATKPSADSLIASTFDALKGVATSVVPSPAAAPAPAAAAPAPVAIAPVTRVVSTIAIHTIAPPDQTVPMNVAPGVVAAPDVAPAATPETAVPVPLAPAPVNAAPIPAARPASIVASVKPAAPTPAADPAPAAAPQPQAAASGKIMVVGNGTGVIVHASASGASPKLFVLAAGQKVTVIGSNQGWRNIVDAQGRRGWAYSDYLN